MKVSWSDMASVSKAVSEGGTWQAKWKTLTFYDGKNIHCASETLHDWQAPDDQSVQHFLRLLTFDCEIRAGIKP